MIAARIDRRSLGAYGLMALPVAFAGMPLYIYMPDFYVREWGLSLSMAGIILLVLRCIDAGQDLVIGQICDRIPAWRGRIIAAGAVLLCAGMAAVLHGPPVVGMAAWWFAGAIALAALGLSVININLVLIGGLWQSTAGGRLRVAAWRESFTLLGMMMAAALPALLQRHMDAAESFRIVFWVFAAFIVVGGLLFRWFWARQGAGLACVREDRAQAWQFFKGNHAFFAACFLTHLAAALPAALFLFFVRDYMGAGDTAGLFLLLYLGCGILGMPLWQRLAQSHGQERAWMISMIVAVCAFGGTLALAPGDVMAFALICVLSGAALGADLSIPPAMMAARLVARGQTAQGSRAFAIMNMIPKIALGIASGAALVALGHAGYEAGSPINQPQALALLAVLYAGVPCVMKMGALLMLHFAAKGFKEGEGDEFSERSVGDGRSYGA